MNNQNNLYLITKTAEQIESYLIKQGKMIEIHIDPVREGTVLGNIYIGRIKDISQNTGAAFVEIAKGEVCYLPLDDMKSPIFTKKGASSLPQQGDELLVQISREAIKTKYAAVTTNLTIHGKYVLLTSGNKNHSVSSKLSREKREHLKEFLASHSSDFPDCGWIIRTNASESAEHQLMEDMEKSYDIFRHICSIGKHLSCFSCVYRAPDNYLKRLSDLYNEDAEQIICDDSDLYQQISNYLTEHHAEDLTKLVLYEDTLQSLRNHYSLDRQLTEALQEHVWLKCGGYLVIQPTEALTVIDVNSGKYETGKKKEEAFFKINREAAIEIARQIRLRNLSGIILVDFINMEEASSNQELLKLLEKEFHKDPIRTTLVDMTKLSLVEITRQKKEKPLHEVFLKINKKIIDA